VHSPDFEGLDESEKMVYDAQIATVNSAEIEICEKILDEIAEEEGRKNLEERRLEFLKDFKKTEKRNRKLKKMGRDLLALPEFEVTLEECKQDFLYGIRKIQKKSFYLRTHKKSKSKGTGRVFTNITNLPKRMRRYLRLDGEPLVNVDVRCAQPCLLSSFFLEEDSEERAKFSLYMREKDVYSDIMSEVRAESGGDYSREDSKRALFGYMFGEVKHQDTRFGRAFARMFPVLDKLITSVKNSSGYKECAYLMQRREVEAVLYGALLELSEKGIKTLSIHDSLMCKAADSAAVSEALRRHFSRIVGFEPVLRIEGGENLEG
jgi:hypothetical protein